MTTTVMTTTFTTTTVTTTTPGADRGAARSVDGGNAGHREKVPGP